MDERELTGNVYGNAHVSHIQSGFIGGKHDDVTVVNPVITIIRHICLGDVSHLCSVNTLLNGAHLLNVLCIIS